MKVFSILASNRVSNEESLLLRHLPKLVIGFIDNDAFSSNYAKNPFNFKLYDTNFVSLYMDGEQMPVKPLQPGFENGCSVKEYMQLVQMISSHMKDHSLLVDRKEFAHGYTLFAFDLSPDQKCADHYSLIKTGNLTAEVHFAGALITTINMIVYGIFDNMTEINQQKHVLFNYMQGWTLSRSLGLFFPADPYTREAFVGIYPHYWLPRAHVSLRPASMLVNMHLHNQPGEHWLAILLADQNHAEFFDLYGYPPNNALFPEIIMSCLKHNTTDAAFQRKQLQHSLSMACGYHCVVFLHHRNTGLPFEQLLKLYSNDLVQNDQMVMHFVKYEYRGFPMTRVIQNMFQKTQICLSCNDFNKCSL